MPYKSQRKSGFRRKTMKPVSRPRRRLQQNRQVGPYGARGVGPIGALARGAAMAYRNRGVIREATNMIRNQVRRKFVGNPKPMGGAMISTDNVSHTLDTTSRSIGRYPKATIPRTMKLLNMAFANEILRYQGVTNFDTNGGWFPLANRGSTFTGGELVKLPMNGIDLNTFCVNGAVAGNAHYAFEWTGLTSDAGIVPVALQGQNGAGDAAVTRWLKERSYNATVDGRLSFYMTDAVHHEWTQMKLNLYGARHRTTTFYIDFIRFKDPKANFFDPVNSYLNEAHDAAEYLTGGLIYSNLIKRESKGGRHLQFVKRLKYTVAAETSLDLNTATGKVKSVNIFLRHGRVLRYDRDESMTNGAPDFPSENPDLAHAQADGADWQQNLHPNIEVHNRAHLYCVIRAFAPVRGTTADSGWAASTFVPATYITPTMHSVMPVNAGTAHHINNDPSYDLVVRNKYSCIPKKEILISP